MNFAKAILEFPLQAQSLYNSLDEIFFQSNLNYIYHGPSFSHCTEIFHPTFNPLPLRFLAVAVSFAWIRLVGLRFFILSALLINTGVSFRSLDH